MTEQAFDEVGVRRDPVHPLPPPELTERLKDTIAVIRRCERLRNAKGELNAYNVITNENRKLNRSAAISVFGDIAATAWTK